MLRHSLNSKRLVAHWKRVQRLPMPRRPASDDGEDGLEDWMTASGDASVPQ